MIIYVDFDGTLVTNNCLLRYEDVKPYADRITIINQLYDEGHKIIIYTARCSEFPERCEYLKVLTEQQLDDFGVKYHELDIGNKPDYDLLIDDKAQHASLLDAKWWD